MVNLPALVDLGGSFSRTPRTGDVPLIRFVLLIGNLTLSRLVVVGILDVDRHAEPHGTMHSV